MSNQNESLATYAIKTVVGLTLIVAAPFAVWFCGTILTAFINGLFGV